MEIESDPQKLLRLGKINIIQGIKCSQELVQRYKDNLIPESAGMVNEIMAYFQFLQRQAQEIESLVQQGEALLSSNISVIDLHHGQNITQIREQNANFGPTLNQDIEMVMNPNIENRSSYKRRKLTSAVWEHFIKHVGIDGKEWARCKYCEKDFVGSSKSGTTHLKNHLKSCSSSKNPGGGGEKAEEKSVIDPELNVSDFVRKIIKYGINIIKNDILDVYQQEKEKLHKYFDKMSCRFSVTLDKCPDTVGGFIFIAVCFIDDNWKLKNRIIALENEEYLVPFPKKFLKHSLQDWNLDKNICAKLVNLGAENSDEFNKWHRDEFNKWRSDEFNEWLTERASLRFIGNVFPVFQFLDKLESYIVGTKTEWNRDILDKMLKILKYFALSASENKFQSVVKKAQSIGRKVNYRFIPTLLANFEVLEWVMEYKEVFCELEQIDPDFKSINFIEEDWDKATAIYNCWKSIKDAASGLYDRKYNTANLYFPIVCDIFFKLRQWEKSVNSYVVEIALSLKSCFDEYWSNSNLFLVITVILDPRFKMDSVKLWCNMIYGNDAEAQFQKFFDVVTDIFNEYAKGSNSFKSSSSIVDHGDRNSSTPFKMLDSMGRPCKSSERINDVTSPTSELERYLKDSKFPVVTDFDLLAWWHVNSPAYPTLARMVRDFFAIPVSAPVEYLDSSLATEVEDIFDCNILDYDLRAAWACTKIWLHYTSEN